MQVIYYSRNVPEPAILAAVKHRHPDAGLERAWRRAADWWRAHRLQTGRVFLLPLDQGKGEEQIFVAVAPVPPPLAERTLTGLWEVCGGAGAIIVMAVPSGRRVCLWRKPPFSDTNFRCWRRLWPELEALVGRARLIITLRQKLL